MWEVVRWCRVALVIGLPTCVGYQPVLAVGNVTKCIYVTEILDLNEKIVHKIQLNIWQYSDM